MTLTGQNNSHALGMQEESSWSVQSGMQWESELL